MTTKKSGGFISTFFLISQYFVVAYLSAKLFYPAFDLTSIKLIPILYSTFIVFYYVFSTLMVAIAIPAAFVMNGVANTDKFDNSAGKIKFTAQFAGMEQKDSKLVMWMKRVWNWMFSIYSIFLFAQVGNIYACVTAGLLFVTSLFILSLSRDLKAKIALLTLAGDIN